MRVGRIASVAAIASLFIAACGSDSTSSSATEGAGTTAGTTAAAGTTAGTTAGHRCRRRRLRRRGVVEQLPGRAVGEVG